MLHGKGLEALDGEVARTAADDGEEAIFKQSEGGVVPVTVHHHAICGVQSFWYEFRLITVRGCVVARNSRCCCIAGDAQGLPCLLQRQLRGKRVLAVRW